MYTIHELIAVVTRGLDRPSRITTSNRSAERLRCMDAEFRWFGDFFLPKTSKAGEIRVSDIAAPRERSVQSLETVELYAAPLTEDSLNAIQAVTTDNIAAEHEDVRGGDGANTEETESAGAVDQPEERDLPAIEPYSEEPEAEPEQKPRAPHIRVLPPPESKRRKRREVEATPAPPPPPKPLKVIRRRKEEAPKVFETSAESIPEAMLHGIELSRDEE